MFYIFRHNYKKDYLDAISRYEIGSDEKTIFIKDHGKLVYSHTCDTSIKDKLIKDQYDHIAKLEIEIFELKYKLATLCDSMIKDI